MMTFGKSITINAIYRVLNVLAAFFVVILVVQIVNIEGYGILSLMIANAAVFNLITSLGADSSISYHIASSKIATGRITGLLWTIIAFQGVVLGIVEFIVFKITGKSWVLKSDSFMNVWTGFVFLLSVSITEKYSALFLGRHQYNISNRLILYCNIFMIAVFLVLYIFFKNQFDSYTVLTIYVGCSFLQAIVMALFWHLFIARGEKTSLPRKNERRYFFTYSLVALFSNVIQFLAYRIDYWFLEYYRGEQELGWYALAVKLSQFYWLIPTVSAGIVLASYAVEKNSNEVNKMELLMRCVNGINVIASLLVFFSAGWLIPFFFGEKYFPSISLFRMLMPGYIFFCFTIILAAYFAGKNKLLVNLMGSSICLAVILVLDLWLIPSMGMKGAAIASTVGYSVSGLYSLFVYFLHRKRISNLFIPLRSDVKEISFLVKPNNTQLQ